MLAPYEERYTRRAALPQIGWHGQDRLAAATVVIVGCGALGTVSVELLARAGVGHLRLVDDDYVEHVNLVGQTLFDEQDARTSQPKVLAASHELRRFNPAITVEPVMARLNARNAARLVAGADLALDGTDNDAARFLINEVCVQHGIPWILAGVVECYGLTMNIVPGETPCFACIFGRLGRRSSRKKNEKGALASVTHLVASLQVGQALRLLLGDKTYRQGLVYVDAWEPELEILQVKSPSDGCPTCGRR
jgi:molybdopterin-synthase adenylyltransferase